MKTTLLSICFFFQFSVFSQDDAYSFIEKGDFSSADSVLCSHSSDPSYFFNFDLFFPLNQALNNHTKCEEFIDFELQNGGRLQNLFQFYDSYIQLKQKKISNAHFEAIYKDISAELFPSSYSFFGMLSCIHLLKSDSKVSDETIKNLLIDVDLQWSEFIDRDTSENLERFRFLRTFNHYQLNKLKVDYQLQPSPLLLETDFSFELQQDMGCIPFFDNIWTDFDVFNDKFSLLEGASFEEQKIYSVIFLCESPTKENHKKVQKIFKDDELLSQELAKEFDFFNPTIEFPDSIQNYIKANSKPGNWIVLDVWGTWCSPCVAELPTWQKFTTKHKEANLSLLLLSAYSQDWEEFLRENEYTFPNLEIGKEEITQLGITGFPTTFLVSPNGNVAVVPFGIEKTEYISIILGL